MTRVARVSTSPLQPATSAAMANAHSSSGKTSDERYENGDKVQIIAGKYEGRRGTVFDDLKFNRGVIMVRLADTSSEIAAKAEELELEKCEEGSCTQSNLQWKRTGSNTILLTGLIVAHIYCISPLLSLHSPLYRTCQRGKV